MTMAEPASPAPRPSRGIYLLPNLFTTGGLFAGFYAIIAASQDRVIDACIAVFIAGVLDGLDGQPQTAQTRRTQILDIVIDDTSLQSHRESF